MTPIKKDATVRPEMTQEMFSNWIDSRYPDYITAVGKCAEACHAMKAAFPDLRLTNGEVEIIGYTEPRLHWWLVDEHGDIIDPTVRQFPSAPFYIEADENHPARNYEYKRCPNCGDHYYATPERDGFGPLCSQNCATEYAAYCQNPLGEL